MRNKANVAVGSVCSGLARASPVAQPPSAGITAAGGGAPCVTTNGTDSAKQSQRSCRTGGGHSPPYMSRANLAKQSQPAPGAGDCGLLIADCGLKKGTVPRQTMRNKAKDTGRGTRGQASSYLPILLPSVLCVPRRPLRLVVVRNKAKLGMDGVSGRSEHRVRDDSTAERSVRNKANAAAEAVCSGPARACPVAQPPTAGITAAGGGAPCVTANGGERAKQSQRSCRTDGGHSPPCTGRADLAKQSQSPTPRRFVFPVETQYLASLAHRRDQYIRCRQTRNVASLRSGSLVKQSQSREERTTREAKQTQSGADWIGGKYR